MRMEIDLVEAYRLDTQRNSVLSTAGCITAKHNGNGIARHACVVACSNTKKNLCTALTCCNIIWVGLQSKALCHVKAGSHIIGLTSLKIVNLTFRNGIVLHVVDEYGINTRGFTQQLLGILYGIGQNRIVGVWSPGYNDRILRVTLHTDHGAVKVTIKVAGNLCVPTIDDIGSVRLQAIEIHIAVSQVCSRDFMCNRWQVRVVGRGLERDSVEYPLVALAVIYKPFGCLKEIFVTV